MNENFVTLPERTEPQP